MADALVLNYNDSESTIKCLKQLRKCSAIDKIVIVDNASTDNSYNEIFDELSLPNEYLIQSKNNKGYGSGNNLGIKYLKNTFNSKFILLLNPDVLIDNEAVETLEHFLDANVDFGVAAPKMFDRNGVLQSNTAFKLPNALEYIFSVDIIYNKLFHPMLYDVDYLDDSSFLEVDAVSGSCFMMNADYMIKYGMFDENIFLYCEEVVLFLKLKSKGIKTALLPSCHFIHNHSVSINKSYKTLVQRKKLMNTSKKYVLNTYYNINKKQQILVRILSAISLLETRIVSLCD